MRFVDPHEVACSACGIPGKYRVGELLGLRAKCLSCGESLDSAGQEPRAGLTDWVTFVGTADLVLILERKLDMTISDADLEGVRTGNDLVDILRGKVSGRAEIPQST